MLLSQDKKLVQHENSIFAICNSTLLRLHYSGLRFECTSNIRKLHIAKMPF